MLRGLGKGSDWGVDERVKQTEEGGRKGVTTCWHMDRGSSLACCSRNDLDIMLLMASGSLLYHLHLASALHIYPDLHSSASRRFFGTR